MTPIQTPDLSDLKNLLECATYFVHDRIHAMQSDVQACLFDPQRPAPFSALLYCFSDDTIATEPTTLDSHLIVGCYASPQESTPWATVPQSGEERVDEVSGQREVHRRRSS